MPSHDVERHPVEELAEQFLERYRRGERPSLEGFAARHPELAGEIRDLFPALLTLEQGRPAADGPILPEQLGDFRIVREVGRGGMGVVYEARQLSLGRRVALKVLPHQAMSCPTQVQRFRREAESAARLHHTNIVPVFGTGEHQGTHYYAMEFIQGQGLDRVLRELRLLLGREATERSIDELTTSLARGLAGVPFPSTSSPPAEPEPALASIGDGAGRYREAARIGVKAAEALAHAHEHGVLHRDVKPSNLLLDSQGNLWVTDFGLARAEGLEDLTATGDVVGTLRYLPPERLSGQTDARGDIYSLGLTLYELLALRPAFDAPDRDRLLRQVSFGEVPPLRPLAPGVPRDLETVVLKALREDPARRYQTAAALADDLRRHLEGRPVTARRAHVGEHLWRWCRRNPVVASLAAAVFLSLVGGVLSFGWQWRVAERQRKQAEASFARARRAVNECFDVVTTSPELQEPGLEEVRKVLLRTALPYYQEFLDQRRDDPALREELARTHSRVGYIEEQIGNATAAAAAYDSAAALYAKLAAAAPENLDFRVELGRCHHRKGVALDETGAASAAEAEGAYALALEVREAMAGETASEARRELAQTLLRLGMLHTRTGQRSKAEAALDRSVALYATLAEAGPGDAGRQTAPAEAHLQRAIFLSSVNRLEEAKEAYLDAIRRLEAVHCGRPDETEARDQLAYAYEAWAIFLLDVSMPRDVGEALRVLSLAVPLREELVQQHPRVARFQVRLGVAYSYLGLRHYIALLQIEQGGLELDRIAPLLTDVETAYRQGLAVRQRLADRSPDAARYQSSLARSLVDVARICARVRKLDEAEVNYRKALAILRPRGGGAPGDTPTTLELADCLQELAEVLGGVGMNGERWGPMRSESEALACLEEAIALNQAVLKAEPKHPVALRRLWVDYQVRAMLHTDRGRHAAARADWLRADQYIRFVSPDNSFRWCPPPVDSVG